MMLNPLTGTRFIAAFFVFLSHMSHLRNHPEFKDFYMTYFNEGYIGVSFFFMLSGFILAYNYRKQFIKNGPIHNMYNFYIARFARIYPVHFFTFLITIPLILPLTSESLKTSILQLTLTQAFIPIREAFFSYNAVSWSISVEMFFYLIFPFLIVFWMKFGTKMKSIILLSSYIILLILYYNIEVSSDFRYWAIYVFPISRLLDFMFGIVLVDYFYLIKDKMINEVMATWLELGLMLVLFFEILNSNYFPQSLRYSIAYLPLFSLLILIFAWGKGRISRLLSSSIAIKAGEISFSFYMIHFIVINYLYKTDLDSSSPILFCILSFLVSLLLSIFIYTYLEKPCRIYIKSINWKSKKAPLDA